MTHLERETGKETASTELKTTGLSLFEATADAPIQGIPRNNVDNSVQAIFGNPSLDHNLDREKTTKPHVEGETGKETANAELRTTDLSLFEATANAPMQVIPRNVDNSVQNIFGNLSLDHNLDRDK
ncbi:MAG: hypothetical protein KGS72_22290 [Cyanobacteria bacterium REEB67]|nr:hypothetical protein [Cyanobacteria bacterium REEB67]